MKFRSLKVRRDPAVALLKKILKQVTRQTRIMDSRDLRAKSRAAKEHKIWCKTQRLHQAGSRAHIRAVTPKKKSRK